MTLPLVPVTKHLQILPPWHGLTVFDAVRRAFPEVGPRDAFRKARLKEILRNDARCHPLERLGEGDVVTVVLFRPPKPTLRVPQRRDEEVETALGPFGVVWEDEDLLAVSKPSGCASHPALGHAGDTLIERVRAYLGVRPEDEFQPALANRLDLETSGIVLVGKTPAARGTLGRRLQRGLIESAIWPSWPAGRPKRGRSCCPLQSTRTPEPRGRRGPGRKGSRRR
jgi:23S rRNA pseudouridine955/2504/2580 synthase